MTCPAVRMFPAYLQGMETRWCKADGRLVLHGSQPTYKEWKQHLGLQGVAGFSVFPAYLQGMETFLLHGDGVHHEPFPAYLQGMETAYPGLVAAMVPRSQPTYKEWKPVSR